jgi:hypothetical protein
VSIGSLSSRASNLLEVGIVVGDLREASGRSCAKGRGLGVGWSYFGVEACCFGVGASSSGTRASALAATAGESKSSSSLSFSPQALLEFGTKHGFFWS